MHQRELHSDTPTFALALRAALRQAPKVILVGEMRDRETIEIALTPRRPATSCSRPCIPSTPPRPSNASSAPSSGDQQAIRTRLAASFRYFVSQRLIPKEGGGRIAVLEILKSTMRTREYMEKGETEGKSLLDAMRDGELDGMQHFDGELEKLVRAKVISLATALLYATNAGNLRCNSPTLPPDEARTGPDSDACGDRAPAAARARASAGRYNPRYQETRECRCASRYSACAAVVCVVSTVVLRPRRAGAAAAAPARLPRRKPRPPQPAGRPVAQAGAPEDAAAGDVSGATASAGRSGDDRARARRCMASTCTACHGADLRGGQLAAESAAVAFVLNDQHGELILPVVRGSRAERGMPAMPMPGRRREAVAEYIHSVLATSADRARRRRATRRLPNILVGDATAGQAYFAAKCAPATRRPATLQGIAHAVFPTRRRCRIRGSRAARSAAAAGGRIVQLARDAQRSPSTVTLPSGEKVEGPPRAHRPLHRHARARGRDASAASAATATCRRSRSTIR